MKKGQAFRIELAELRGRFFGEAIRHVLIPRAAL